MSSVLGVSVGTSAVRLARPNADLRSGATAVFRHRAIDTTFDEAEQLAAESIGVEISDGADRNNIAATGVAYRDDVQAGAMAQAMARQHIANYRLIPEVHAALRFLHSSGELAGLGTVALYDLGSSGLSVSIVDLGTGEIVATERSLDVGGNMFDALIRDNQLGRQQGIFSDVDARDFEIRCRTAKEQLSDSGAVCLPGSGGLILLSREAFEAMIAVPVENSARMVKDLIDRSGRTVDALVLVGGGSNIPLVRDTLGSWTGLRLITPDEPELVAAKGAALLATPVEHATNGHASVPTNGHSSVSANGPAPASTNGLAAVENRPPEKPPYDPLKDPLPAERVAYSETAYSESAYSETTSSDSGHRETPVTTEAYSVDAANGLTRSDTRPDAVSAPDVSQSRPQPDVPAGPPPRSRAAESDVRPVSDPRSANAPSWLTGAPDGRADTAPRRSRVPVVAAVVLAVIAAVGLALGYGGTSANNTGVETPVTTQAPVSPSAVPTTSSAAPPSTLSSVPPTTSPVTTAPPAPAEQAPSASNNGGGGGAAVPAPAPAPAPAPIIPGLPQFTLPNIVLPPLPVIPGL
ncbi:Hsp70 family protein [Actinomycetes bacterium M1A6_2h]